MMKHKYKILIIINVILLSLFMLSSCSTSSGNKTPEDLIKDAYGDETFRISFYQENLDEPIDDIYYSANNMPKLPIPQKLGYIFEGWYFDSNYTKPYEDGCLYLYMENVLLYAKFQEEEFSSNGIYKIEYECNILEDTIVKGSLTDKVGFSDITNDLVSDNIYIEKSSEGKLLQFQYDCNITPGLYYPEPYSVTLSAQMSSKCRISNSINVANDPIKTLYINIDKLELSDHIYFEVTSICYDNPTLPQQVLSNASCSYTIDFHITKLLGYETGFEDTENELDNGTYLVKTYYRAIDNSTTMMNSFNSVFSYLIVKNGNYKLVKQFYPYSALVGNSSVSNYYERLTSLAPFNLFYRLNDFDYKNEDTIDTNKTYQEEYDARNYGSLAVEFDSESGKFYYIYDLGTDYRSPLIENGAVTGFMELMSAMGDVDIIMYLDLDSITKIASIDYNSLEESSGYTFSDTFDYSVSDLSSLNNNNKTYESSNLYGISNYYYNFFYSTYDNSSTSGNKMYSYRMVITPDYTGNVCDLSNETTTFYRTCTLIGYDGVEPLYIDTLASTKFSSIGLRKTLYYENGKSFNVGDVVNVYDIFNEKVNKYVDSSEIKYNIYYYSNNKINYSSCFNDKEFVFSKKCIIEYEFLNQKSSVVIDLYEDPIISVNNYDEDYSYVINDVANVAEVSYTWMGVTYNFYDDFYESSEDIGLDPTSVCKYELNNNIYELSYFQRNTTKMTLYTDDTILCYQLRNKYGELYNLIILSTITLIYNHKLI